MAAAEVGAKKGYNAGGIGQLGQSMFNILA